MYQNHLEGFLKYRFLGLNSRTSDSVDLGWDPRLCISNKIPRNPVPVGPRTTFGEPPAGWHCPHIIPVCRADWGMRRPSPMTRLSLHVFFMTKRGLSLVSSSFIKFLLSLETESPLFNFKRWNCCFSMHRDFLSLIGCINLPFALMALCNSITSLLLIRKPSTALGWEFLSFKVN